MTEDGVWVAFSPSLWSFSFVGLVYASLQNQSSSDIDHLREREVLQLATVASWNGQILRTTIQWYLAEHLSSLAEEQMAEYKDTGQEVVPSLTTSGWNLRTFFLLSLID
jgi:hypothetical protein